MPYPYEFYCRYNFLITDSDELIREIQIGKQFSLVIFPSCESSENFHCTTVFEVPCLFLFYVAFNVMESLSTITIPKIALVQFFFDN